MAFILTSYGINRLQREAHTRRIVNSGPEEGQKSSLRALYNNHFIGTGRKEYHKVIRLCLFFAIQLPFLLQLINSPAMCGNNDLPKEIFKHWTHSYEEDAQDVKVFRLSNYNFPPARGREGFEIKENGEFIQYMIGPTDIPEKFVGHWKAEGKDKITAYFEKDGIESYSINIVSCTNDVLRIKK